MAYSRLMQYIIRIGRRILIVVVINTHLFTEVIYHIAVAILHVVPKQLLTFVL